MTPDIAMHYIAKQRVVLECVSDVLPVLALPQMLTFTFFASPQLRNCFFLKLTLWHRTMRSSPVEAQWTAEYMVCCTMSIGPQRHILPTLKFYYNTSVQGQTLIFPYIGIFGFIQKSIKKSAIHVQRCGLHHKTRLLSAHLLVFVPTG